MTMLSDSSSATTTTTAAAVATTTTTVSSVPVPVPVSNGIISSTTSAKPQDVNDDNGEDRKTTTTTSVCVIGCGPGGMFFCHALEKAMQKQQQQQQQHQQQQQQKQQENTSQSSSTTTPATTPLKPLKVTVFERAGGPGGVWRSERSFGASNVSMNQHVHDHDHDHDEEKKTADINISNDKTLSTTNATATNATATDSSTNTTTTTTQMYEALWTNGPKEGIEFYDYSYQEHFSQDLPVYMPRQALLEYMVARCLRHCPDFFTKYNVQFYTAVLSVQWVQQQQKFKVITQNILTRETKHHWFHKCVWAAGDNGRPYIPHHFSQILSNFPGRVIHSTDTANFAHDVRNKRILIVGGSYSAEDLALMACKVGVKKVYIVSRESSNVVTWTEQWPNDKIQIICARTPVACCGNKILLSKVKWVDMNHYEILPNTDQNIATELEDIDTVILCTGYSKQFDMLHEELQAPYTTLKYKTHLPVPSDWKMTDNILTSSLGEVKFSSNVRWYGTYVSYPQVYNCLLINNPNMIFLRHNHNDYPILGVDAYAHLVVRYLIGEIPIPTSEEMTSANQKQALYEMQFPYARYYMDSNYRHAWDNTRLVIPVSAVDSDCIDHDNDTAENGEERALKSSEIWEALKGEYEKYDFRIIAHIMQQANYPLSIGTYEALNETGETLYDYGYQTYYDRAYVNPDDSSWRTFRDTQKAHKYRSLYTGTPAVCLPKRWIDINESKEDVLELIRLRQQQQQQQQQQQKDKNDETTTTTTKFVGQQQQPIATTSQ